MNPRHPILLSPYRLPTETTQYLGDEEVSAFLNGYIALWHPAALFGAETSPQLATPYDHEQPMEGALYAVPDNPALMLPDDWRERAADVGAVIFTATADRAATLANLTEALRQACAEDEQRCRMTQLPADVSAPFFGLGFGCLVLEGLFEAMSHENVLASGEFWQDVQSAVGAIDDPEPETLRNHLQSAADRLLIAREVVYAVSIYTLDLALLDELPENTMPASWDAGQPISLLACASLIEKLAKDKPDFATILREKVAADQAEIIGGPYIEREDPLLPLESQLWNLLKGQQVYQEHLGQEVRVFARKKFGFHAQLPLLLQNTGLTNCLLVSFDEAMMPSNHSPVVSWPSQDGKQVDSYARTPLPADSPQTYFHLAHHLHQTIMQDQTASLALLHRDRPASPWYRDWLELSRLSPVLGKWVTMTGFFTEVQTGDYTAASTPDEFQADYLAERPGPFPISGFAKQVRGRRKIDAAWTFDAILRSLGGQVDPIEGQTYEAWLAKLEDRFETGIELQPGELQTGMEHAAIALTRRLQSRAAENQPGYMLLNPCSFIRRVAVELADLKSPLPVGGPIKSCQINPDAARLVVEVPALGFAWLPSTGAGQVMPSKMRLADERAVRNEFIEAEIDPQTGGLKAIRDTRTRSSRLGGQLIYGPGSVMRAGSITTTSAGPALGEIITEGAILGSDQQQLATFRIRYRAWLGRPLLEMRIELFPLIKVTGHPWSEHFAARFAWRDERATLLRGAAGMVSITSQNRPESPEFLDIRVGRQNAVIFPGGLPFHQRHGARMIDVLLVVENEPAQVFELGLGVDRDHPMQTALGMTSPLAIVQTSKGPPHIGATGWLYHLDAANLLLTSLHPLPDGAPGVMARMLEVSGNGGPASFRCARNPSRAQTQDARGNAVNDAPVEEDAVLLDVMSNDLVQLRVEF